jgi:hypothetical protein
MQLLKTIGLIMMIVGIVLGIGLLGGGLSLMMSKDPANSNEGTVQGPGGLVELGEGTHMIWYKGDVTGPITVEGPGNITIPVKEEADPASYGDIHLFGTFETETSGEYAVVYVGDGDIYVTEEFSKGTYMGIIIGGAVAGALILIVGIVLFIIGSKKQKESDLAGFFHQPRQPPAQPPAPPPQQ